MATPPRSMPEQPGTFMPRAYVHLRNGLDVDAYRLRHREGREPDETPYGFHHATEFGYEPIFSRDVRPSGLVDKLLNRMLGFDYLHAWRNRARMAGADIIWTMTERDAFAVAALMETGRIPPVPILGNSVWLFNEWKHLGRVKRALYRRLSRHITLLTVHSRASLPLAAEALPGKQIMVNPFGISAETYGSMLVEEREADGPIRIVAAGNDRTRDWDVLLAAFGGDDRFHLTIICDWFPQPDAGRYPNVAAPKRPRMDLFKSLYASAHYIAVPMHENLFSGITVAMEAALMGKPLVVSRTGGVPTYFDDGEVLFVPPGDPVALRTAVLSLSSGERQEMARRAKERFWRDDYSTRGMMRRYADLSSGILAAGYASPLGAE